MADGTVTGEFRLTTVQARRELGQVGREAQKADVKVEKLGNDLDKVGSTKQQAQIRKLRQEVKELATASRGSQREISKLTREVERLSVAAAKANSGRGGGGGGRPGAGTIGGLVGMGQSIGMVGAKAAIALPLIRALGGAVGALGVTAASALGGAGAVGAAGIAGVATGIGGIMSVAIPATKAIKEAADAQKKYNEAVRDYGRASREAGEARDVMRSAYGASPRGTRSLIAEANAFSTAWKRATRSGSEALVGFAREVIRVASSIRKPLADIANRVTRAFASQGSKFARFLGSDRMLRVARAGAGIFTENIGNVRRVGQAAIEMFGNIVRASKPFVKQFTDFLAKWFGRGQRRTRDIKEMRTAIGKMVDDLKAVGKLGGAGIRLLMALVGAGGARAGGRSLLKSATDQLDKWTKWVNKNPEKIRSFFRDTVEQTKQLGTALKDVVGWLYKASDALTPLLSGLTQVAGVMSAVGPAGSLMTLGALRAGRKSWKSGGTGAGTGSGGPGGGGGAVPLVIPGGKGPRKPRTATRVPGKPHIIGPAGTTRPAPKPSVWAGAATRFGRFGVAGKAAAKAAWPITLGLAGLGALGTEGGPGRRLQGAAAMVIPGVDTPSTFSALEQKGVDRATAFADKYPEGTRNRLDRITTERGRVQNKLNLRGRLDAVSGDERKTFQKYLDTLKELEKVTRQQVQDIKDLRSVSNADAAGESTRKAFDIRRKKFGVEKAGEAFVEGSLRNIGRRGKGPGGKPGAGQMRAARTGVADLDALRERFPQLQGEYEQFARRVERRFRKMGQHVVVINGSIYKSTDSWWRKTYKAITSQAEAAAQEASDSFTRLQRNAAQGLMDMGYSRHDANTIIRHTESITHQNPNLTATDVRDTTQGTLAASNRLTAQANAKARGGRIRGRGLMDTVPLVDGSSAAPGELIVNRHTEASHDADAMAYGLPTLAQRINGERRPHSAPRRRTPRTDAYRLGGRYEGVGVEPTGVNLMGANAGLAPYAALGQTFGLRVSSGARPGAITNAGNVSLHSSGNAIDVAGAASGMLSYGRAMAEQYGTGLDELIHTPMGFGIKNGQRVAPYAAADHYDHVHVGDTTPGGAAGAVSNIGPTQASTGGIQIPLLKAPKSKLGGIPGALASRAMEIYTEGINRRLQSISGGGGGAAASGPVSGDLDGWLTQALTITNQMSPTNLAALRGRAMQESGGDPHAQNNWDSNAKKGIPSKGLLQTIDPTFQAYALPGMQDIWNPVHNAVAAIRYMLGRYGHIVAANGKGYETGGRMDGFFRALGTPSLFQGKGKANGGEIKVSVNIANVSVGSDGNAGAVGAQIGEQVAAKLAVALRAATVI